MERTVKREGNVPVGVAVLAGGSTVGSPTSVRNTGVGLEGLGHVGLALGNELLQFGDLAHFLECADLILLVTIHGHTGRIIATVFQSGQAFPPMSVLVERRSRGRRLTIEKGVNDELAIPFDEVVDVAENSTVTGEPQCPKPQGKSSHIPHDGREERMNTGRESRKMKIREGRW
jgi:hypothetical protein